MIQGVIIKTLIKNHDERGWLTEIFRRDELDFDPVMSYISLTNPGVIRGPHEHVNQSDCFVFWDPGVFAYTFGIAGKSRRRTEKRWSLKSEKIIRAW